MSWATEVMYICLCTWSSMLCVINDLWSSHYLNQCWLRPVWASEYCCCLRLSVCVSVCQCLSVRRLLSCPCHNLRPIQARITKSVAEVQSTLVKIPIVLGGDWSWPSRLNLTLNKNLPHFVHVRIITCHLYKLGSQNLDQGAIYLG